MELENYSSTMAHTFSELFQTALFMGKGDLYLTIGLIIKDRFGTIWQKEEESMSMMLKTIITMEIGQMIFQMGKAESNGVMEQLMKENLLTGQSMDKDN